MMDIKSPVAEARNEYTYSASGQKLKVVQKWNPNFSTAPVIGSGINVAALSQTKTTDYVGNIIYENSSLKRILVDGGYIEGGAYYYYLTDHLGNNRVVANANGTVIQKNHYYPFGMAFAENTVTEQGKQPYKYNGKELDQMHGLNMYDYSARFYEPSIGRFSTVDPLAEKFYSWSPYTYCYNNPIKFIDPDGKRGRPANIRPNPQQNRGGTRHAAFYQNGIRPSSTMRTTSTVYRRKPVSNNEPHQYIKDFNSAYNTTVQMTNNNTLGKAITLVGDIVNIRVEAMEKKIATENGIKTEKSTEVVFDDRSQQLEYDSKQTSYDKEFTSELNELNEGTIKDKGELNPLDYFTNLNTVLKKLGPSPKKQVLNWLENNKSKYNTIYQTEESLIPEIRQGY